MGGGVTQAPESAFLAWLLGCSLPGEFDSMDSEDQARWKSLLFAAFEAGMKFEQSRDTS
jgi:hypothetical protein